MVKGTRALNAIHRILQYLNKTIGIDDPFVCQHACRTRHCAIVNMHHISAAGSLMTVASVAMSVFMMLLELLVCYIQALVFTMLSAVFISLSNIQHAEHEESK